jgi:hypothetical protein
MKNSVVRPKEDASLDKEQQKAKIKAINHEIYDKIKAVMSADQFTKWEKLQAARRAARK